MARLAPLLLVVALAAGCAGSKAVTTTGGTAAPAAPAAQPAGAGVHRLASGLVYEDLVVGNGRIAETGLRVNVHYTGWLADGTKFESSLDSGQPLSFTLGNQEMIAGWDQGIKGMRVGGRRKLTIPPDLAYGAQGSGNVIPPNATLVFEIQLLGVR
jgi:FKBP-type peptidyl-prolyl cis-trans isomerase